MDTDRIYGLIKNRPARRSRFMMAMAVLLLAGLVVTGAAPALAKINDNGHFNPNRQGGFIGLAPVLVTVEQTGTMRDGERVRLRGYLRQNLGNDIYFFEDKSGGLEMKISEEMWRGQQVGPDDLVEIRGEIDREAAGYAIEVTRLRKF